MRTEQHRHVNASRSRMLMVSAALIVAALSVAAIAFARGDVDAGKDESLSWSHYQVTYRVDGHFAGLSEPIGSELWRVDHDHERSWRRTILESTRDPRAVGEEYAFGDQKFVVRQASSLDEIMRDQESDILVMPDWWLVPGRDAALIQKGFSREDIGDNRVRYVLTEEIECLPEFDSSILPASCAVESTFILREVAVYRTDVSPGFPIELTSYINDELTSRIEVLSLVIGDVDLMAN